MADQPTSKTPASANPSSAGNPSKATQETVRDEGKGANHPPASMKPVTNGTAAGGANGANPGMKSPAQGAKLPQAKAAGQPLAQAKPAMPGQQVAAAAMMQARPGMAMPARPA